MFESKYIPQSPYYQGEENPSTEEQDALEYLRDQINEKLQDESAGEIFEEWTLDVLGHYRIKWYQKEYFDVRIVDEQEAELACMRVDTDSIIRMVARYQYTKGVDTTWMEGVAA